MLLNPRPTDAGMQLHPVPACDFAYELRGIAQVVENVPVLDGMRNTSLRGYRCL